MSIKEEFEKDFKNCAWNEHSNPKQVALHYAKWMAERCAEEADKPFIGRGAAIRQLAKELS